MKLRIIIEEDESGMFVVECPALPGCISQGKTRAEAIKNIQDAMKEYLESLKRHDEPIPITIPNHKEIAPGTLRAIIRQLGLTREEFLELLSK